MKENDNVNRSESVKKTENIEMFSEYGDIVSIDDVMSMLHIGRSAVYSLLRNQSIKNVMVGGGELTTSYRLFSLFFSAVAAYFPILSLSK